MICNKSRVALMVVADVEPHMKTRLMIADRPAKGLFLFALGSSVASDRSGLAKGQTPTDTPGLRRFTEIVRLRP